jgi:hypothetical protein
MAISLEDDVKRLNAESRLRWEEASNSVDHYMRRNSFYDGVAACLDVLADRFADVSQPTANISAIIRGAASELWELDGDGRDWQQGADLQRAVAMQHLLDALIVECRRTIGGID